MSKLDAKLIVMSEKELEELIYKTVNRANSQLYDGLAKRFLHNFDDDIRAVLIELEDLNRK